MLFLLFACCLILSSLCRANAFCTHDEDLQGHRCTCSLAHGYVQCSSMPKRCRTCYLYKTIFFDEHVDVLAAESFRDYDFFDYESNRSFTIQFAHVQSMPSRTFAGIALDENRSLSIQIAQYSSTQLPTQLFGQIEMPTKAKIDMEIHNVSAALLTVEPYAFHGIQHGRETIFRFAILSMKHTIEFQANAGTFNLPSYSSVDLYFSNFVYASLKDRSFSHLTQDRVSNLQIHFDHFHHVSIGSGSLMELHQLDRSRFQLIFSNFRSLKIEHTLFSLVTQLQSSLIFSLYNMTSDLCLPANTFHAIKQDSNSSLQFEIDYGKNIYLGGQAFSNVSQTAQSKLSVIVRNSHDVHFASRSMTNIRQQDRSLLDLWIKSGRNLIFEEKAIENVDLQRSSILTIGYLHSNGVLQMDTNAFANVNEGQGSQILFQLQNSSDFYLQFNHSMTFGNLEIIDRILTNDDLCRIRGIPPHLPVKILPESPCSCSVLYLYRQLHRTLSPLLLRSLTPRCYFNLSPDQIEHEETQCSFDQQLAKCPHRYERVNPPTAKCLKHSFTNRLSRHTSASFFPLIVILLSLSLVLICIYSLAVRKRRLIVYNLLHKYTSPLHCPRRSRPTAESYEQLTHVHEPASACATPSPPRTMQIVVKYDSTTLKTHPHLQADRSDFIIISDGDRLQLNSNPLADVEDSPPL